VHSGARRNKTILTQNKLRRANLTDNVLPVGIFEKENIFYIYVYSECDYILPLAEWGLFTG
jgi:hypothetical protein